MIRRATPDDAPAISDLFVRARDQMAYLPPIPTDDRSLLGGRFLERAELWVAERDGHVVGFAGVSGDELTHLYVDPSAQRGGIGTALLEHVQRLRPDRLELWVFQKNEGARRFYERCGFYLVRTTNGAENMEREPDALYEWRGGFLEAPKRGQGAVAASAWGTEDASPLAGRPPGATPRG